MQVPTFILPAFPHISPSFVVNLPVLILILAIFFVIYLIVSGVLVYHWKSYGMKSHGIMVAQTLFLFVSVILFTISGLALYYF